MFSYIQDHEMFALGCSDCICETFRGYFKTMLHNYVFMAKTFQSSFPHLIPTFDLGTVSFDKLNNIKVKVKVIKYLFGPFIFTKCKI